VETAIFRENVGNDAEYVGKYRKAVLLSEARVTKRFR
jgi:hypothetical protein